MERISRKILTKSILCICGSGLLGGLPSESRAADAGKIFLTTASYGVVAGSLTGLASLAFYQKPGEHIKNIALGASLGLYAGILMGAYIIYLVPDPYSPRRRDDSEMEPLQLESRHQDRHIPRFLPYVASLGPSGYAGGVLWQF